MWRSNCRWDVAFVGCYSYFECLHIHRSHFPTNGKTRMKLNEDTYPFKPLTRRCRDIATQPRALIYLVWPKMDHCPYTPLWNRRRVAHRPSKCYGIGQVWPAASWKGEYSRGDAALSTPGLAGNIGACWRRLEGGRFCHGRRLCCGMATVLRLRLPMAGASASPQSIGKQQTSL